MKLLWISDSPDTPSGFGNVTRFVCEGLARRGHQVNILGWQTKEGHEWNGCQVHPNGHHPLGSDAMFRLLLRLRPEVVIALGDVWWLPYFRAPHVRRQMEMIDAPWALYFPIDGDMEGERLPTSWTALLGEVDVPIAMSRYGRRVVEKAGLRCHYIPHGVDLGVFCPPTDREAAKKAIGAGGKFLVLSDSRNQPRKMLPRLLEIFSAFSSQHPEALLHLHTDPEDDFARSITYSYDVRADVRHLGLESKVRFSPGLSMRRGGGLALADLATYYQAADVHLLASSGEGFGLPTLQAAAAGAVPMAGGYSASQELVEGHGEAIAIAEWTENEFGIRRGFIDIEDGVRKLARYYDDGELLRERSALSHQFSESYGWEQIIDEWDRLLSSMASRRGSRITRAPAITPPSRAKELMPSLGKLPQGISVKVKLVEHDYGHLEASIVADTRGKYSDVSIPTVPKASVTAGVKVVRLPGYIGVSPGDRAIFDALHLIFPVLSAWIPCASDNLVHDGERDDELIKRVALASPEQARFDLAQSVLLLNLSTGMAEKLLWDAAFFGIVCVGSVDNDQQQTLWPEAAAHDQEEAVVVARALLTNAAFAKRTARKAQEICRKFHNPDEKDMADWLRRLAAPESAAEAVAR